MERPFLFPPWLRTQLIALTDQLFKIQEVLVSRFPSENFDFGDQDERFEQALVKAEELSCDAGWGQKETQPELAAQILQALVPAAEILQDFYQRLRSYDVPGIRPHYENCLWLLCAIAHKAEAHFPLEPVEALYHPLFQQTKECVMEIEAVAKAANYHKHGEVAGDVYDALSNYAARCTSEQVLGKLDDSSAQEITLKAKPLVLDEIARLLHYFPPAFIQRQFTAEHQEKMAGTLTNLRDLLCQHEDRKRTHDLYLRKFDYQSNEGLQRQSLLQALIILSAQMSDATLTHYPSPSILKEALKQMAMELEAEGLKLMPIREIQLTSVNHVLERAASLKKFHPEPEAVFAPIFDKITQVMQQVQEMKKESKNR